jgi:outer membrane receptor protein involved in Fe transport
MHRTERAPGRFRTLLLASSIWVVAAALSTPAAAAGSGVVAVNIPAGSLDNALAAIAGQTHQQVLYTADLVEGRRAPALHGDFTPEDALNRLLEGTGITVRRTGPGVLVLEAPHSGPEATAAHGPFGADGALPLQSTPNLAPVATVEELTVTGSNLRNVPVASPLVTLSRDDLDRSGQTTVADALRDLPANFAGGAMESFGTGGDQVGRNGSFSSGLNLRGLGNNATLVLMNGHRIAGSGTFADFVDISTIPSPALDRVEVLLDGASAIYGADAVGGVVNFIMKRDYDGAETRLLAGTSTQGGRTQYELDQTFGRTWENGGFIVSYLGRHQDDLLGSQRVFAATTDLRPLGGTDQRLTSSFPGNILVANPVTHVLTPGFAIPGGQNGVGLKPSDFVAGATNLFNQRQGADLLPDQTLNAIYLAAHQGFGGLDIAADVRASSRHYKNINVPRPATFTVTTANPFFVSPIGAKSESIAYSFGDDVPNPIVVGDANAVAATLSATVKLPHAWRAEAFAAFAQQQEVTHGLGVVNNLFLNEALGNTPPNPAIPYNPATDGYFNPFNGIPGGGSAKVLALINSGFVLSRGTDQVTTFNVQADGPVWRLPGGEIQLAVGAQTRREGFVTTNRVEVATPTPQLITNLDLSRTVTAGFAELQVPLFGADNARPGLQRLELSLAGRVEHYDAFGTTGNPKLGVLWSPIEGLQFRATYGHSFRAPALREIASPAQYNSNMLALGSGRLLTLTLSGGNPDLRPETANSWTLGVDWQPARVPGLKVSATGFDIAFKDRIEQPVAPNLQNALQDPTLSAFVTRISPATSASDLALIQKLLASPAFSNLTGTFPADQYGAIVENGFVNAAALHVQGIDLSARYRFDALGGSVLLAGDATGMLKFDQRLTPTSPTVAEVNVMNFPPRFRSRVTADWTRGRLTLGGAFNYTGAYHDVFGVHIDAQPTFDLQVRLAPARAGPLAGVVVLFNVRNVFDRDPPFYNNSEGIGYDAAAADPIGRYVSIQLTRAW